jgi:hypothetical protein
VRRVAIIIAACVLVVGCGGKHQATTTTTTKTVARNPAPSGLRIGLVGPLSLSVPGAHFVHASLPQVSDEPLVIADASVVDVPAIAAAADANPSTHFAIVGASTKGLHRPNLVGLVIREEQAARLAGVVAAFVIREEGGTSERVAWVGPQENRLFAAFKHGVRETVPDATVLHSWSQRVPSRCKEAALGAIGRGATVLVAHRGLCADAVADAAHEQNHVALGLTDFELPSTPAAIVARDAVAGVYHGGEDLVFGAPSGAIGVRSLDRRVSADTALRARTAAQQLASGLRPSG